MKPQADNTSLWVRFAEEDRGGYEIGCGAEVLDYVSVAELSQHPDPHLLMQQRIRTVHNRLRVRRFVQRLAAA